MTSEDEVIPESQAIAEGEVPPRKRRRKKKGKPGPKIRDTYYPKTWDEVERKGVPEDRIIPKVETDALKKYPPPSTNELFQAKWSMFIEDVSKRENFKRGHLSQLEVLCDLYVQYDTLRKYVHEHGFTYMSVGGRNGTQIRPRPEAMQMNRVIAEIRSYSKALGLILVKDKATNDLDEPDEDWGD